MHYGQVTITDGDDSDFEFDLNEEKKDDDAEEVIFVDTSKPDSYTYDEDDHETSTCTMEKEQEPQSCALVVQGEVRDVSNFQQSIETGRSSGEDDSSVSFGDKVAQTIGNWQYAPSAPAFEEVMSDQEKHEYEEWLRCTQLSERRKFPSHKKWQKELQRAGAHPEFNPVLEQSELPTDIISADFKRKAAMVLNPNDEAKDQADMPSDQHRVLIEGVKPASNFSKYDVYVPRTFDTQIIADKNNDDNDDSDDESDEQGDNVRAWLQAHHSSYDEVSQLVALADSRYKIAWRNPAKNVVPQGAMWVVSDHRGESTGKRLEIWGPGCKPRFRATKGKRKGRVGQPLRLQTEFAHIPGRFTIVVIRPNEIGFALNLKNYKLRIMLPGRYFVQEHYDNYIGKAPVTLGEATDVEVIPQASDTIRSWAERIQVVSVAYGHAAFCMAGDGIFVAPHRSDPWIIDRSNDEAFLSMVKLSDRHVACTCELLPSRPTYDIVNLQPDEYVVFRDQYANSIVYRYNAEEPRLNTLHIPSLYFGFTGHVHKITDGTKAFDDITIIKNNPQDFVVVRDPLGNIRFFEGYSEDIIVLRHPWQLLDRAATKASGCYTIGQAGHEVSRVILTPAEWAIVQLRSGEIKFYPPILADGIPYYFYQPFHTLHGIANRFAHDEQTFEVPGYKITVVNLTTGELGACRIQNVNMFLNPRPLGPYVFVSPDEFLGKAPVDETHFQAGDLHYVRIQADERACVIRDGEAILLPSDDNQLAKENKGNGVYIFRARQNLKVIGPRKKTDESYSLGPWQFFNVPPGHVGYGTRHGKLHVWSEGQHSVNISNNEQFSGFFQTNVDPVVAKDVEVMCKHAITSRLTITVTYMISDPLKTIKCFGGDHPKLHRFINSLATSKILELCAKRPPMGFSEADFDPRKDQMSQKDLDPELVVTTDQAKVSGELLSKLRQHPEVRRAGIHIGFAEIQEWKIDEAFMKSSKEIAMRLQSIHAVTERKRMELEQSKLDNLRKMEMEKSAINETKLVMERERVKAETKKQQAVILAQQQAETKRAAVEAEAQAVVAQKEAKLRQKVLEAECDKELAKQVQEKELIVLEQDKQRAESQKALAIIESQKKAAAQQAQAEADAAAAIAKKEAELKQQTLAAQAAKEIALKKQEQQEIENQTNIKQAQAQAMMKSAAMTAERMAQAKAEQEAAKLELQAAQTLFEANKIKAASELEIMKAKAEGERLLAEAKISAQFPGLSPQERAQCLLSAQMMQTHSEIAKRTQQVYHTMDPEESQRVYEQQMRNMMGMSRSVAGFMGGRHGLYGHNFSMANTSVNLMNALHSDPFMQKSHAEGLTQPGSKFGSQQPGLQSESQQFEARTPTKLHTVSDFPAGPTKSFFQADHDIKKPSS